MGSFEIAVVFVVINFVEKAVSMLGDAVTHEFAVGSAQCVEDGVVEFLVVSNEV